MAIVSGSSSETGALEMAKSLKEQNNWKLGLTVAVNSLFYYGVLQADAISVSGFSALLKDALTLVPVGIGGIIATVLNSLPSADVKAALVYWRLKHALPGHRAFSVYADRDTRINKNKLLKSFKGKLPFEPETQNAEWYKLYKSVRNDVVVSEAHRSFLFLRDYVALSAMFIVIYGLTGLYFIETKKVAYCSLGILVLQYLIVRQAAHNAGVRMVTNVLALKTSGR